MSDAPHDPDAPLEYLNAFDGVKMINFILDGVGEESLWGYDTDSAYIFTAADWCENGLSLKGAFSMSGLFGALIRRTRTQT